MSDIMNFGHLIEGTLERDPMTDRFQIHTVNASGQPLVVDLQDILSRFVGQDVRFTLAGLEGLRKLAELVEKAGGGDVLGIPAEAFPNVPFNIQGKS